jgi:hypothetical protein
MESEFVTWLGQLGSAAFRWSVVGIVVVNGLAVAAFAVTRDRALVNRWTGRLLGANLLLIGAGLGVPLATSATRLAISLVSPRGNALVPTLVREEAAAPISRALTR